MAKIINNKLLSFIFGILWFFTGPDRWSVKSGMGFNANAAGGDTIGDWCSDSSPCLNYLACDNGVCNGVSDYGSTCSSQYPCKSGLVCQNNVCERDCQYFIASNGINPCPTDSCQWCSNEPTMNKCFPKGVTCPNPNVCQFMSNTVCSNTVYWASCNGVVSSGYCDWCGTGCGIGCFCEAGIFADTGAWAGTGCTLSNRDTCGNTYYRCGQGCYGNGMISNGCYSCADLTGNVPTGAATTAGIGGINANVPVSNCYIPGGSGAYSSCAGSFVIKADCYSS